MDAKRIGEIGEEIAARYLARKGYEIRERNFKQRFSRGLLLGEIDIIAQKGDTISFVEVKTVDSSTRSPWDPEAKFTFGKRLKIERAIQTWLADHHLPFEQKLQIDVIAVFLDPVAKKARIRHFPNV